MNDKGLSKARFAELIARARTGDEAITNEQLLAAYHDIFQGMVSNAEHIARILLMAGAPLCLARPRLADKILDGVIYALTGSPIGSSTGAVEAWAEEVAERIAVANHDLYGDPSPEESSQWVMAKVSDGTFYRMTVRENTLQQQDSELREALGDDNARAGWFYYDQWDASTFMESTEPASLVFFIDGDMDRARTVLALVVESLNQYDPDLRIALWAAQWPGKSPPTPIGRDDNDQREEWVEGQLPRLYWIYQGQVVATAVFGTADDEREIDRHTSALAERLKSHRGHD
jgi:hypothetical protein